MKKNLAACLLILYLAAAFSVTGAAETDAQADGASVALPSGASLPEWPKPAALKASAGSPAVRCGDLELVQSRGVFGGFVVRVVNGLRRMPKLKINGKNAECVAPQQFLEPEGRLILRLEGKTRLGLAF